MPREIIAVRFENHTENTNTLCVYNGGYGAVMHELSYHFALKG
jgi:hypothetical protein